MPLRDYHCETCEKEFELLVGMKEEPVCPECGGKKLHQLISAPAPSRRLSDLFQHARAQAAKEGHFSNYAPSEKPKF